jgi:hypothetical protein
MNITLETVVRIQTDYTPVYGKFTICISVAAYRPAISQQFQD